MWGITTTNKTGLKIDKCIMSTVPSNPLQKLNFQPQKTQAPDQKTKVVYLKFIDFLCLHGSEWQGSTPQEVFHGRIGQAQ
jgi:hypothetical protein